MTEIADDDLPRTALIQGDDNVRIAYGIENERNRDNPSYMPTQRDWSIGHMGDIVRIYSANGRSVER